MEKKEEAVANATTLIFIGKLRIFSLVKNIFSCIYVPREVLDEMRAKDSPEREAIEEEFDSFLKEVSVEMMRLFPIHIGERAAISYCLEKKIPFFLSDDLRARRFARTLGLDTRGIIGVLLRSLENKAITKKEFLVYFQRLINAGFYCSPQLRESILKLAYDY